MSKGFIYRRPRVAAATTLLRPQNDQGKVTPLEQFVHTTWGQLFRWSRGRLGWYRRLLPAIHAEAELWKGLSDSEFDQQLAALKQRLRVEGFTDELLVRAFAAVRDAAGRAVGMYHFDSQLLGGLAIFHGNIAEMQTGEGKTLTAVLPAATAALAGIPVHVVTANDYLATRDAEEMRPVYERLGLSVGSVTQAMTVPERQPAYHGDLLYCSNSELVFDYLKDSLVLKGANQPLLRFAKQLTGEREQMQQLMLRGLHFAVVDEADSVLLDEARTPLVISGEVGTHAQEQQLYHQALSVARALTEHEDFRIDRKARTVTLLKVAEPKIDALCKPFGGYWIGRVRRLELAHKALTALYLFELDVHYLVRDGKVMIIDEHSGRVMADRTWEQGLHQMIEVKEECELTNPRQTLARMSYQRFFRLYRHLGGMTGTAQEVADELWSIYRLPVVRIPTHRPSRRRHHGVTMLPAQQDKWQVIAERVAELHKQRRSILIGTSSVHASEALAEALREQRLEFELLTARHDQNEADVVGKAGQPGQITVATSMAGRGTDIKLSDEAAESGGLHVILSELQDSARIDRQLIGRCARQGDPGSYEMILSVEDIAFRSPLVTLMVNGLDRWLVRPQRRRHWLASRIALGLMILRQRKIQTEYVHARKQLLDLDEQLSQRLAFATEHYL